ncbi:MAG: phosphatase PAP2 family protein [Clostridia bacterium]|nr:phosphatase PAP2 family protein [Clostridia bacterium]
MRKKDNNIDNETKEVHKMKNGNFFDALQNALNGIIYAITTQSNIKKQLVIAVAVMLISLFFDLNKAEFLCLMFTVVLIIVAEMINTAIETVVDLYTDLYHPKAKIAKDVGAGAVVLTAINALIVAYFLFFEKISTIGLNIVDEIANSPTHLAFVAIVLTVIVIVTLKAAATKNNHKFIKENFMPSGQTAVAFAGLTIIWLTTRNVVIFTLSLVLALIVAINRYENGKRTKSEVVVGAWVGIMVVVLLYGLAVLYVNANVLSTITEFVSNFTIGR